MEWDKDEFWIGCKVILLFRSEKLKDGFTVLILCAESEGSALDLLDKALSLVAVSYRDVSSCLVLKRSSLVPFMLWLCVLPSYTGTDEHRQRVAMATAFNQRQMAAESWRTGEQQIQGTWTFFFSKRW